MRGSRLVGFLVGASAIGLLGTLTPAWGGAQKSDPGQGERQSQKEISLTEGAIVMPSDEGSTKESFQGRERPLNTPVPASDGSVTQLKTPDANDSEDAQADLDSAMSY